MAETLAVKGQALSVRMYSTQDQGVQARGSIPVVVFNGLFAGYVLLASAIYGGWPKLDDLQDWQRLFLVSALPIQAASCEELIWRDHLIPALVSRGRSQNAAILLSAISFAFKHGVFLADKLLVTLLLGWVESGQCLPSPFISQSCTETG